MITTFAYLASAILFILGIKNLGSPKTAPRGNRLASLGMLVAIVVTLVDRQVVNYPLIAVAIGVGALIGIVGAKLVKMTAMPQMVALFNGFGGGASSLVAAGEFFRLQENIALTPEVRISVTIVLSLLIGCITFTGSLIAFSKLQGIIKGQPITYPLQQPINIFILIFYVITAWCLIAHVPQSSTILIYLSVTALLLGILFVLPIGGADMPVVISLLNSLSGVAASLAGFIIMNDVLIISGALVGASGLILTQIMCKAMNRSITNVLFGSFGKAKASTDSDVAAQADKTVRSIGNEEAAMVLAFSKSVVIVPGYGMAVAQAQHGVREVAQLLEAKGIEVKYAIHPVAGRMPGHMNVLLAEANVPYGQLKDMEDINPEFPQTDVVLVIGANDVVNPAARSNPGSPIYGMPVLEVDKANHVIVVKRSLNPGFAGIDNELFYQDNTMMLFGGAKEMMQSLAGEIKGL